ncbi:MAG: cation-translocating P-type ATPase [Waddliaceae bacterium]
MRTNSTESQPTYLFEPFFEKGQSLEDSPFLTPYSRNWGGRIDLKASLLAAFFLILSFAFSFFPALVPYSKILLIMVYFLSGIPALIESIEDLLNMEVNIDILMTIAAFSSVIIGSGMEGGLLLVLFAISGSMEQAVRAKASNAIQELHHLSPSFASVVQEDGSLLEKSVREIEVGTHILVKSGQVVPLDGVVVEGVSSVTLEHLTGENFPVTKKAPDIVPAGAVNLEGALTLLVTRTSSDSTVSKIIQLVTEAQEARPKLQRWFDRVSESYAKAIILLAALFSTTFPYLFQMPFLGTEGSLYRALAFLIAASPCALILALPIAYLSAVSVCARRGILLKGGIALDALAACSTIALDKTGTLTTGDLNCLGVEPYGENSLTKEDALGIAYQLEKNAVHPVAKAILGYVKGKNIPTFKISNYQSVPGYGLEGKALISGREQTVYIGHPEYIKEQLDEKLLRDVQKIRNQGEMVSILKIENEVFIFRFLDTLRKDVSATIQALQEEWKMTLVMLTGDHEENAKRIAGEVGIENFKANLRPEDKLRYISEMSEKKGLAMVGDGINDAPALARASVGICMGKVGTTAAMDASDIVFLHDTIDRLDWLVGKAHQTQRIVKQNLVVATAAIIIASFPALGGYIPLWLAVVMHEGGTVLVGLNALRLLRI